MNHVTVNDKFLFFFLEEGIFIGLEFSGRIFRLVHTSLNGNRSYVTSSRLYEFPDAKPNEDVTKVNNNNDNISKGSNFCSFDSRRLNTLRNALIISFPVSNRTIKN